MKHRDADWFKAKIGYVAYLGPIPGKDAKHSALGDWPHGLFIAHITTQHKRKAKMDFP